MIPMKMFFATPLAVLFLARLSAVADDARWPQFRGPGGQGIGREGQRLPVDFGVGSKILWKTPLPKGHSSPCVWDERIYVTSFDAKTRTLETICLARADGRIMWRQPAPVTKLERVHQLNTPASATPATDGEQVYVYFGSYGLLCYSKDGDVDAVTVCCQRPSCFSVRPFEKNSFAGKPLF